jgi:hypothetical protein
MKKWKLDRIISIATLLSSVVAIVLVLKKPQPIAPPIPAAVAAAKAESFQQKIQQLEQPREAGQAPPEVHLSSQEVSAALAQATGALPAAIASSALPTAASGLTSASSDLPTSVPSSADAPFAAGQPDVKDYQVNFEGDVAKGQFVTQIGGKTVTVTLAGHLGSKDGYATFDPTEFKVGDLDIPVSLVNGPLQKKLEEQRDRLKLPDDVGGIKVDKGELVMTGK